MARDRGIELYRAHKPEAALDEVQIDGQPVPAVIVGVDRAIDPGDHLIRVTATGFAAAKGIEPFAA